jgi:hypothetical protein
MRMTKKLAAGVAAGAIVLGGGGVALAYWTSLGGAGSAQGINAAAEKKLVVQMNGDVNGLFPGGPAKTVTGMVTNPNDASVRLQEVSLAISGTSKAGCTGADYTISDPMPVNEELVGKAPAKTLTFGTIQFKNDPAKNQDACKGATVYVQLVAS